MILQTTVAERNFYACFSWCSRACVLHYKVVESMVTYAHISDKTVGCMQRTEGKE
jgi:hypothetical protein